MKARLAVLVMDAGALIMAAGIGVHFFGVGSGKERMLASMPYAFGGCAIFMAGLFFFPQKKECKC